MILSDLAQYSLKLLSVVTLHCFVVDFNSYINVKLQKSQKGDITSAHRLNVNVLLSNITF